MDGLELTISGTPSGIQRKKKVTGNSGGVNRMFEMMRGDVHVTSP